MKPAIIGISITFISLAAFVIIFILIYYRKQRQIKKDRHNFQTILDKTLLQSQIELQEQILNKISQEIHDNIGQSLSLAKLNLNTLDFEDFSQLPEKIKTTGELVSRAIIDLRELSHRLNTDKISTLGLAECIKQELNLLERTGSHKVKFEIKGVAVKLPPNHELILFRIVQEAIQNILKHAKATIVNVSLNFSNEHLFLRISDNGIGFNPNIEKSIEPSFSLGIRNMNSRLNLIGGQVMISSNEGSGTVIDVTL